MPTQNYSGGNQCRNKQNHTVAGGGELSLPAYPWCSSSGCTLHRGLSDNHWGWCTPEFRWVMLTADCSCHSQTKSHTAAQGQRNEPHGPNSSSAEGEIRARISQLLFQAMNHLETLSRPTNGCGHRIAEPQRVSHSTPARQAEKIHKVHQVSSGLNMQCDTSVFHHLCRHGH